MNIFEYAHQKREQNHSQQAAPIQQDIQASPAKPDKPQRMTIFDYARNKKAQATEQVQQQGIQSQTVTQPIGTEIAPGARIERTMPGIREGLRHAARLGSRAAEVAGGAAAGLIQGPQQLAIYGAEKLAGKELPYLREKAAKVIEETGLPTTQSLRKKSEELTGGFTKAQTQAEEDVDEAFQDFVGFALPGTGTKAKVGGKLITNFGKGAKYLKAIGLTALGQGAKQTAKAANIGEEGQQWAKTGAQLVGSLWNPKGASTEASSMYKKRDASYNAAQKVPSSDFNHELNLVENKLRSGGTTPSGREVLTYIKEIKKNIKHGAIGVKNLTDVKVKTNQYRNKPIIDAPDRRYFNEIAHAADREIAKFGKLNPDFYKYHKAGDEMYSAIAQSRKMKDFIKNEVLPVIKKNPIYAVPALGLSPAYAGIKAHEIGSRIWKSPKLMNYYSQALMHASKENASAVARDIERLNNELEKEFKKTEEIDLSKYR